MGNVYDLILEELEARGCADVQKYPPFYICSLGAHMFNLMNQKKKVLRDSGIVENTRLQILMVSPPGFSKSFWLRQFIGEEGRETEWALLGNSVPSTFENSTTGAGFVGTIKWNDSGEPVVQEGMAAEKSEHIIGIEEFSGITKMMRVSHSSNLGNHMLTALDNGMVRKRLSGGKLSYETNCTLWTGSQPRRVDLASGFGRRFLFLENTPGEDDKKRMKKARRDSKRKQNERTFSPHRTQKIRDLIKDKNKGMKIIDEVKFPNNIYNLFDKYEMEHFEEPLYERLILGYNVMKRDITPKVVLRIDDELERLIDLEVQFRKNVGRGTQFSLVKKQIDELADKNGRVNMRTLKDALIGMGLNWKESAELLKNMNKADLVDIKGETVMAKW